MTDHSARMPNFESGFFGFHHTVDSALRILSDLGVSASRVTLRMDGLGLPSRWVVSQDPPAGSTLSGDVRVKLSIAGLGYFHALPVAMWDKGDEHEPGTREIVEVLDDPYQKAAHWIREGARLFEIKPDNFAACSRWIALFGLAPNDWPPETWYNLSLLLPSLHQIAAAEHGIRLIFQLLLQLPVKEILHFPAFRSLPNSDWSLLGNKLSRLGIDCIVGDRMEDLAGVWLVIGPVPLATYYEYQEEERMRLFMRVLGISSSCLRKSRVSWLVMDQKKSPRLGCEAENARLGINSHLGQLTAVG